MFSSRLVSRRSGSPRSGLKRRRPGHRGFCTPSSRSGDRWEGRTTRRSSAMCWKPAFALVPRSDVPVLVDYPVVIEDESDTPLACTIPLSHDVGLHPAIAEALGLRAAYERHRGRTGRTFVSRLGGPERVPELIEALVRVADGISLDECGLPATQLGAAALDVRGVTTKRPRWPSSTTYPPRAGLSRGSIRRPKPVPCYVAPAPRSGLQTDRARPGSRWSPSANRPDGPNCIAAPRRLRQLASIYWPERTRDLYPAAPSQSKPRRSDSPKSADMSELPRVASRRCELAVLSAGSAHWRSMSSAGGGPTPSISLTSNTRHRTRRPRAGCFPRRRLLRRRCRRRTAAVGGGHRCWLRRPHVRRGAQVKSRRISTTRRCARPVPESARHLPVRGSDAIDAVSPSPARSW